MTTTATTPTRPRSHLTDGDVETGPRARWHPRRRHGRRGEPDARYIRRSWRSSAGWRPAAGPLLVSLLPPAWLAGTAMLAIAKILENMEIGHNVLHGQWDWMRDPEIHSTTWEWDFVTPADAWKHTHNDVHHTWTNVLGKDRDVGYSFLRVSPDQPWRPWHLAQPLYNAVLAAASSSGASRCIDLELDAVLHGQKSKRKLRRGRSAGCCARSRSRSPRTTSLFPLLSGPSALPALLRPTSRPTSPATSGPTRSSSAGTSPRVPRRSPKSRSRVRPAASGTSASFSARPTSTAARSSTCMTGNLSHQIEHHLFPDLPSNRYAEIAPKVRELCTRYDLPYTSGRLTRQYGSAWKRILRLTLPSRGRRKEPAAEPSTRHPQAIAA